MYTTKDKYRFVLLFIFVQNAPLNCINRSLKSAQGAESTSASNINLIRGSRNNFRFPWRRLLADRLDYVYRVWSI